MFIFWNSYTQCEFWNNRNVLINFDFQIKKLEFFLKNNLYKVWVSKFLSIETFKDLFEYRIISKDKQTFLHILISSKQKHVFFNFVSLINIFTILQGTFRKSLLRHIPNGSVFVVFGKNCYLIFPSLALFCDFDFASESLQPIHSRFHGLLASLTKKLQRINRALDFLVTAPIPDWFLCRIVNPIINALAFSTLSLLRWEMRNERWEKEKP